jgi:hypothetical protein
MAQALPYRIASNIEIHRIARLLKFKNDESRFGLTRATVLRQCGVEASQSSCLASHCTERKFKAKGESKSKLQIYFDLLPFLFVDGL